MSAFFYRTCILQPRGVRWIIPFSDVHFFSQFIRPKGGSVAEWRCRVTVLGKLFTPIVHQAAKLVATLLRVAEVTAGLAESNDSLPPGLWLTSPAGWLPITGISSGTVRSVIEYGLPFRPTCVQFSLLYRISSTHLKIHWLFLFLFVISLHVHMLPIIFWWKMCNCCCSGRSERSDGRQIDMMEQSEDCSLFVVYCSRHRHRLSKYRLR